MIRAIVVLRFRTVVLMGGVGGGVGGGEAVVGRLGMLLGGMGLFESSRVESSLFVLVSWDGEIGLLFIRFVNFESLTGSR